EILLRHWDLCCISTFLRTDGSAPLHASAHYTHPHMDAQTAERGSAQLAAVVERAGHEQQVWLDSGIEDEDEQALVVRRAFADMGLQSGVGIPIHARGTLVGVLVALSAYPERLRAALAGLRFVAAPIVIALGNARQAAALREQRERIEDLIAELRERKGALEEANRELLRVGRYRSLFLGRMSHELRTPLTSILGFAEILLEHEALSPAQRRFCEKIQASGQQLHTSIKQLVDLSRLEAGQTELFLHDFSVREMLRESCAAVGRLAQKQCVRLECDVAPELGPIVSDEGKLRQVLYNFMAHAIARSPQGGVVNVHAHPLGAGRFSIDIKDEGEPLTDPAHVFDPVDLDAPNERGTNMNELGLVIAHRLLDAIGGAVTLDTTAARGLLVRLELPTRPQK
ncbi:MAG TPA: HAMP domain-containing sensor histidine kinase, partial [Pyrinomonadaceae bacterium]|nr:HAMP domain-containing sensor histidine kinase [Pyrinomonadaceae bacterium]